LPSRSEITFRPFRHGGFTATGDADLSDADVSAVGAKTDATLDIYRKSTMQQRRRARAQGGPGLQESAIRSEAAN
jgi:hypothetical protein